MLDSFKALSLRERLLISVALAVGVLMIFYLYAWEPKTRELQNLRNVKVPESEQTLAWVKQALQRAKTGAASPGNQIIEGPLLTVIEQTAERAGVRLAIRRIQPNQAQSVRIWMEDVPFDSWLNWVDMLRQQNVYVERASIVRETPGMATIRFTLGRS